MHFIIDGYNLMHSLPGLSKGQLEARREALVRMIDAYRQKINPVHHFTVVFDSRRDDLDYPSGKNKIKIIFAHGISADEKILQMIKKAAKSETAILVSDDRELAWSAKLSGAKRLSNQEFLERLRPKRAQKEREEHLSIPQQRKITEELEKIWCYS
jgi:predicted RNA-binding protein with PIN domain